MARVLIKLVNDGMANDGKLFTAIYGEYSVDANYNYTIGTYKILANNIASVHTGDLATGARIQKLLTID